MGKNSKEEFPNLHNDDGSIGTPTPEQQTGATYCDTCGGSDSTGTVSVYNVESGQWSWETCFSHILKTH